ncbi:hypothetical protein GJ496_005636 [Pomphorhynchus laevis]|nr:hypothetical protein GJ496_005636 [Pomphorhynchus laevis]
MVVLSTIVFILSILQIGVLVPIIVNEKLAEQCRVYLSKVFSIPYLFPVETLQRFCNKYIEFSSISGTPSSTNMWSVFKAINSETGENVLVKVIRLSTIVQCIAEDDIYDPDAMHAYIISSYGCGLDYYYYPGEYFALKMLKGLNNRVPKLFDYYRMKEYHIDVLVMELFLPLKSKVFDLCEQSLLTLEEARDIATKLTGLLIDMVDKYALMHIDLHLNNLFYSKDQGVRIIDFDRIATEVRHEKQNYLQILFASFPDTQLNDTQYLSATPEFYALSITEYLNRMIHGNKLFYCPTRYAVFQIGAVIFHTMVFNKPLSWEFLIQFYTGKVPLPLNKESIPDTAKDLIEKTTKVNYYDRIPLREVLKHPFLMNVDNQTISTG